MPASLELVRHISWASDTGVTTGYDDDTFRPTEPVSHQAATVGLSRYASELWQLYRDLFDWG